jgi:competence protein ComEC
VVMPAAALSVAAMPFGLEHGPLQLMGWSIGVMLKLGRIVSGLPGAVTVTPAFPLAALVLIALGGLWLLIWRQHWRWLGMLPVLAGILLALTAPRPDLMIASDAQTIALRGPDGLLYFPHPPKDHYAAARWLVRDGDSRDWRGAVGGTFIRCDGLGCVALQDGLTIAMARRPEALDDDCARADIVASATSAMPCQKPRLVLGAPDIIAAGGYAVMFSPLRATGINTWRGARPWVVEPSQTAQ